MNMLFLVVEFCSDKLIKFFFFNFLVALFVIDGNMISYIIYTHLIGGIIISYCKTCG